MGIFLFLSPFSQDTSIKEICIYSSTSFALALIFTKKTDFSFKTPLSSSFMFFIIWVLIGLFFALNKKNSIHDIYAHLLKYLAIYYLLVNFFCSKKRLLILTWVMIISGTVYSLWYVIYFYFFLGNDISTRMVLFPYRDYIYVFALLLSINHLPRKNKWFIRTIPIICIFLTTTATLLSQTRNALLAIVLGLCMYFFKYKKSAILILVVFLVGIAITPGTMKRLDPADILQSDRIATNLTSFEIIKDYPIFGIGFGMQTYGYKEYVDLEKYFAKVPEKYRRHTILASPHNLLADIAVRTGIVGLCLFLFIMFRYVLMGLKIIRTSEDDFIRDWGLCFAACFVGFFTQSMFGDAAFGLQAIVCYTILAMMTILWRLETGAHPQIP